MRVNQIVIFKVGHVLVTIWSPLFFTSDRDRLNRGVVTRVRIGVSPYITGTKKAPIIKIGAFEFGRRN